MNNKAPRPEKSNRANKGTGVKPDRKNDPIIIVNINCDDLIHKSDDEIRSLSDRLNKNLRLSRTKKDEKSSTIIEKEVCYIQRELDQRGRRRRAHENFLRK